VGFSTDALVKNLLNAHELEILQDQSFLQTKQAVSKKVISLLSEVSHELQRVIPDTMGTFPQTVSFKTGKISKGENYRGLPYWILDQPRLFSATDTFAFRVMVWWGNEISLTLHLGGKSKNTFQSKILACKEALSDFYLCSNEHPWDYHFNADNYLPIVGLSDAHYQDLILTREFIKISMKSPLSSYINLKQQTLHVFNRLIKVMAD
jgi:hypothetical protein